jgi:hypothetical protein
MGSTVKSVDAIYSRCCFTCSESTHGCGAELCSSCLQTPSTRQSSDNLNTATLGSTHPLCQLAPPRRLLCQEGPLTATTGELFLLLRAQAATQCSGAAAGSSPPTDHLSQHAPVVATASCRPLRHLHLLHCEASHDIESQIVQQWLSRPQENGRIRARCCCF